MSGLSAQTSPASGSGRPTVVCVQRSVHMAAAAVQSPRQGVPVAKRAELCRRLQSESEVMSMVGTWIGRDRRGRWANRSR